MIFRDVTVADTPKMLSLVQSEDKAISHTSDLKTTEIPLSNSPPQQVISVDKVLVWLANQTQDIRVKIAEAVADEVNEIRNEAQIEGRKSGAEQGKKSVREQFAKNIDQLIEITRKAEVELSLEKERLEQWCARIVDEALSKLIGEFAPNPQTTGHAVAQAIEKLIGAREINIRVCRADLDWLREWIDQAPPVISGQRINLVPDPTVLSGGCIAESSIGQLDATWEWKLEKLLLLLKQHDRQFGEQL